MSSAGETEVFYFTNFQLYPERSLLLQDGRPVKIGSRALLILIILVERAGLIVSNRELIDLVWPDTYVEESNIRVHLTSLRRLLGERLGTARFIVNIPGRGYQFIAPVRRDDPHEERAQPVAVDRTGPTVGRLIGRDDILDKLTAMLPQRRLITILGAGGIGKTALVQALTARWLEETAAEVSFVDLAPVSDDSRVASALAAVLQVPVISSDPMPNILQALRRTRRVLVFDSCEHVIDAVAEISETIIAEVDNVNIVTTSREPLRASGEWIQRLQPLAFPPEQSPLSVDDVLSYPAVQLFVERALAISDTFAPNDHEALVLGDLCRRLDGLPLAIELAAARVDMFGLEELARRLDSQLSLLSRGLRTAVPRHRTIRATIDWSYQLLSLQQKNLLNRLSVFTGYFSFESASALAAAPGGPSGAFVEEIVQLVEQSLVVAETINHGTSYRLLGTTRAFAGEKLEESGEVDMVREWHAGHVLDLLKDANDASTTLTLEDWSSAYSSMIDDIRTAMDWAFGPRGMIDIAVRLAAASAPVWFRHSLLDEYRRRLEQTVSRLDELETPDRESEMLINTALGHAIWHSRGPEGADERFLRAIDLADELSNAFAGRTARWGLWLAYTMKGDTARALDVAEHFGEREPSEDARWQLAQERMMALTLHFAGRHGEAQHYVDHVLSHPNVLNLPARNSGFLFDQRIAAKTLNSRLLWIQGFPDRALALAHEGAEEALALGHGLSFCYNLAQSICPISIWAGELETARRYTDILLDYSTNRVLPYWHTWGRTYDQALGRTSARMGLRPEHELSGVTLQTLYHQETAATLDPGLADDVIVEAATGGRSWCSPELLRVKAVRMLQADRSQTDPAAVDVILLTALAEAREQTALSWELRAATTLAESRRARGDMSGMVVLSETFKRFSEGFETADLCRASSLLDGR
ncbi:helix-turn-helix transcriptional regulator [Neorhizobium galegae]|uniref:ATP-binding protein n=1 Tax=Neorhizobium galegae TaxID=399 RepID=UPI002100BF2B|nr:winged helix-turn-helix domain-containing protein [Neorhizobium galegae]MCQ1574639.1 helix-turn-helix transcriptional regulator [Neorhizobium galegae]